jgi:hypothetical protein
MWSKRYNSGFQPSMVNPLKPTTGVATTSPEDQQRRVEQSGQDPLSVVFPAHIPIIGIPVSAQSVDLRRLATVDPLSETDLIIFIAPPTVSTKFTGYAIFSDALDFTLTQFIPTVNGARIFPYHGDPQLNYKIALGLGSDFGNANLIPCQLDMSPGSVLKWHFINSSTVPVSVGIRMSGYVDSTIKRLDGRVGG